MINRNFNILRNPVVVTESAGKLKTSISSVFKMTFYLNSITRKCNVLLSNKSFLNFSRFEHDDPSRLGNMHKVNKLEKKFLVWTGKFKNHNEVPEFVSQGVMEKTRNRMRIKISNYMILATILGCIAMVYLGKQDAKRGESISKQNKEWHARIKAESEAKARESS